MSGRAVVLLVVAAACGGCNSVVGLSDYAICDDCADSSAIADVDARVDAALEVAPDVSDDASTDVTLDGPLDGDGCVRNACGGCSTLPKSFGTPCGTCGVVDCTGPDTVDCTNDHAHNACGGCAVFPIGAAPGDACPGCGTLHCASADAVQCDPGCPPSLTCCTGECRSFC